MTTCDVLYRAQGLIVELKRILSAHTPWFVNVHPNYNVTVTLSAGGGANTLLENWYS